MSTSVSVLKHRSTVIVFTYAPAGLGHLRVTDALYDGLPKHVTPLLLGSQDSFIQSIHRVFSIHPLLRSIFEWLQFGKQQYVFTWMYRSYLRIRTKLISQQLRTVLDQRIDKPEVVIIIATHFSLAHQIGAIKDRFEDEYGVQIILVVQVTDDSPQFMWYVYDADLIIVPSQRTRKELEHYALHQRLPQTKIRVNAYPISPSLSTPLSHHDFQHRVSQTDEISRSHIHVSIPVSGAAVGLSFSKELIDTLHAVSDRFVFHIVARSAPYTLMFLKDMIERKCVKLYVSSGDREVVNYYEDVYAKYPISLEVTKPSEQAFKSLLQPKLRGGSIILFSEPVGRQEYDNISFLQDHELVPNQKDAHSLYMHFQDNVRLLHTLDGDALLRRAKQWRGILLPSDPHKSALFIWWLLRQNVFYQMVHGYARSTYDNHRKEEVSARGVEQFWHIVADHVGRVTSPY